ncbi:MAG: serine hydrolase [bacterium]|nr:serine hydrolase [bacterium]
MENGQWIGINEDDDYDSASLLKVPFMMAYFKKTEDDPTILSKKIYYAGDSISKDANSAQVPTLIPNTYYSVEDLIRNMIVDSDNFSKKLLLENIDLNYVNSVFNELDFPLLSNEGYKVSSKKYSLFFRTLYNATFLNREMSEEALNLLAQAEFKYGLRGGVPLEVPIAHKFGDYALYQNKKISQMELHDCGVVYYPNHPYFLCVMTRGKSLQALTEIIKEISGLVYNKSSDGLLNN